MSVILAIEKADARGSEIPDQPGQLSETSLKIKNIKDWDVAQW